MLAGLWRGRSLSCLGSGVAVPVVSPVGREWTVPLDPPLGVGGAFDGWGRAGVPGCPGGPCQRTRVALPPNPSSGLVGLSVVEVLAGWPPSRLAPNTGKSLVWSWPSCQVWTSCQSAGMAGHPTRWRASAPHVGRVLAPVFRGSSGGLPLDHVFGARLGLVDVAMVDRQSRPVSRPESGSSARFWGVSHPRIVGVDTLSAV